MPLVGIITIGQTPRPDIVGEVRRVLPGADLLLWGALDGVSREAIAAMGPVPGEPRLMVRLASGAESLVAKQAIFGRISAYLSGPAAPAADLWIAWCTSAFAPLKARASVLYPFAVAGYFVQAALPGRRLGVVCPGEGQEPQIRAKWEGLGAEVEVVACPPSREHELGAVATRLAARGAEAIVLDCMGFFEPARRAVRAAVRLPVVLPAALVSQVAGELLK